MRFPDDVLEIVQKAAAKHPNDIPKGVQVAELAARKLPNFDDLVPNLVTSAFEQLVYDARHQMTTAIKREVRQTGGPAKVVSGSSKTVNAVARSVYLICIGSRTLGDLLRDELAALADGEHSLAEGHEFNARLCRALIPLVPKGKRVRDAVSERKLRSIIQQVENKIQKAAGH